ncbi:hypothetical protein BGX29_000537 [Mortierella sp. GBA35]|nr:hypothetical protein BGX29_000537 [Mortierella sp. GBA35]
MRISSFVPAIMAFTLFSASTQALPTAPHHDAAIAMMKRGSGSTTSIVDALVKLFVEAEAKVLVKACADLSVDVCAGVDVKLKATANVLGLIDAEVNVKKLQVKAKADVDAKVKADIEADLKVVVIANIDAHVRGVVKTVCPKSDKACLKKNAHAIVANVAALIQVDIEKLVVKIKADVHARAKVHLEAYIKKLDLNLLGLAKVKLSAVAKIKADINVHLKAFVDVCAKLLINAKLIADIGAL